MMYYLLLPDDNQEDCVKESNQLGQVTFGKFRPLRGFDVLKEITSNIPEIAEDIRIVDQTGKHLEILEFLEIISKLK